MRTEMFSVELSPVVQEKQYHSIIMKFMHGHVLKQSTMPRQKWFSFSNVYLGPCSMFLHVRVNQAPTLGPCIYPKLWTVSLLWHPHKPQDNNIIQKKS